MKKTYRKGYSKKFSGKFTKNITFLLVAVAAFVLMPFFPIQELSQVDGADLPPGSLVITVLDIGQGDSILLQCDGQSMLIDAGEEHENGADKLEELGVEKLDYLVATHPHSDHIGGMANVLERFAPTQYYYTDCPRDTYTYKHTMAFAEEFAGEMTVVSAGDKLTLGSADITVLSPEKGFDGKEVNDYSAVLLVKNGDFTGLFMGDAQVGVENRLVEKGLSRVDFLKIGHHGSYTSSSEGFLQATRPKVGAISLGMDNDYGFPHEIIMKNLERFQVDYFRTDLEGTLCFVAGKDGSIAQIK